MINGMEDDESLDKPLGRWSVFYHGVGHMLNDITCACWFIYLLVFLTDMGLSPRNAAVMLSGQVAYGFSTIFAGELIDRFGRSKLWHGAGSLLVAVSFSSIFGGRLLCKVFGTNSSALETIGYSMFAAIFNLSWAATQVSHMSMVNCMTLNSISRVVLASCRNAFTMVPEIIFICCFVVSVLLQETTWTSDRIKMVYSAGCALWIICGGGFLLLPRSLHVFMYLLSVLAGVANALMTVTGISMQSYLVGEDLNGNAFVYGSLSFMDKISCGFVLYLLESYQNSSPNLHLPISPTIHLSISRLGVGLVPALCAFIGVIVTYALKFRAPAWKPLMEPLLS